MKLKNPSLIFSKTLFKLSEKEGTLDKTLSELSFLTKTVNNESQFRLFLQAKRISALQKFEAFLIPKPVRKFHPWWKDEDIALEILKELKSVVTLDYELQADTGVEVEELTPQRLSEILQPIADEIKNGKPAPKLNSEDDKSIADVASKIFPNLNETLEAVALDGDQNEIFKVPISEVVSKLSSQSGIKYLLLDGIITKRLLEGAKNAGIECVVGHRVAKLSNSDGMTLKTFADLGVS